MAYNRAKANLGKAFEDLIIKTNEQYKRKNRAAIDKVPTEVTVIRRGKQLVGAFHKEKSTVDFKGLANGRGIAFDAKSTRETTRFPLSNIAEHQIDDLKRWQDQGGISFVLVEFAKKQEVYYLPFKELEKWVKRANEGGRKSIPYDWFYVNCEQVKSRNGIPLDYLHLIERKLVA